MLKSLSKILPRNRMEGSMEFVFAPRVAKLNQKGYGTAIKIITLSLLVALTFNSNAQNIANPKVSDFGWLAGNWIGDGFGGISQEVWTKPTANSMLGMYKHYIDEKSTFYEIISILETDGKISMRLKHFNPDMTSWEEKNDYEEFSLISASSTKLEFDGLIYELIGKNKLEIRLKLNDNGVISTEVFTFDRVE